jgi:nucleoside-diphosphate-sugar epimerase
VEITNLVTSPFGVGEKIIFELLKRRESVYTLFPSPKDVPMSFLGKINLKYGFVRFDRDTYLGKILPKTVKNVFHVYDMYTGSFPIIFKSNPCATLLLLDWARKVGVSKFIYMSSGEVYGKGQNLGEASAYNPLSFYATTKFEAEILFRYYHKSFNIYTVRLFFPFGKNLDFGYLPNLYKSIKSGDIVETEYSMISPTFINDVVEPMVKLREIKGNEIFNICGSPVKVRFLVDSIKEISGKSPKKISIGKIELYGDNSKAKTTLGYKETPLEEALKDSFGK